MTTVKQRKLRRKPGGLFKRHAAPRGTDQSALRASRHSLLNEIVESEAEEAIAAAQRNPLLMEREHPQFPAVPQAAPLPDAAPAPAAPKPLGYTQAGPVRANPDYAGKSDLERAAQMVRDLDLEPGTRRGIRVLRASPPRRRSRP